MVRPALTRWLILGTALLATVVASVWPRGEEKSAPEIVAPVTRRDDAPAKGQQPSSQPPSPLELPALGDRLEGPRMPAKIQDLFGIKDWNPPPPPVRHKPLPPAAPTAPPFPYTVAGSVADANGLMIVFNRQKQDFVLRIGDVLEQTYRVEAIDPQSVTVTYLPLGLTQVVPIQP
jgi:hypothetical protein